MVLIFYLKFGHPTQINDLKYYLLNSIKSSLIGRRTTREREAPSSKQECQRSVNRCPERTTLYRARLIFGFEHLPPIRGGPLRARKRFNYLDFVFCLICMSFVYLFLYHACIYSLLDYIESLCGIATPLACLSNYIKFTTLVFSLQTLFARV